jgi:hypothetical protein
MVNRFLAWIKARWKAPERIRRQEQERQASELAQARWEAEQAERHRPEPWIETSRTRRPSDAWQWQRFDNPDELRGSSDRFVPRRRRLW